MHCRNQKRTIANANIGTARIEARIAPDALAMLKRAARITERSLSEFVTTAAQDAARRTIGETDAIRLSVADRHAFAEFPINPPPPTVGLREAFRLHKKLIGEVL